MTIAPSGSTTSWWTAAFGTRVGQYTPYADSEDGGVRGVEAGETAECELEDGAGEPPADLLRVGGP